MTLPSRGVMKASMIRAELKASGRVDFNASNYRKLAKRPSGRIRFSDFYGKSNVYQSASHPRITGGVGFTPTPFTGVGSHGQQALDFDGGYTRGGFTVYYNPSSTATSTQGSFTIRVPSGYPTPSAFTIHITAQIRKVLHMGSKSNPNTRVTINTGAYHIINGKVEATIGTTLKGVMQTITTGRGSGMTVSMDSSNMYVTVP